MEKMQNTSKKQRKKRTASYIFFRILLLALAVFSALGIAGWLFIRNLIKPPEIPVQEETNFSEAAFLPPEGTEVDMLIGNGLIAPEGFTAEDRKELFYTFLIVGLDEGINTDTIMVASYDAIHKEANLISIPRDSLVNVQRRVKKINTAFPAGTLYGGGFEGGIEQLKREVKTIIGFVPDFYVCIDLDAFVEIVDAVGGIDVYVPIDMRYDDPLQDLHIDIKQGQQHLNGAEALKFVRYRMGNNGTATISDYQRMENQQAVIFAVLDKLLLPSNILKIPEFINIFTEYVHSDIKPENMLWFANELNQIQGTEALSTYTLPTTGTSGLPMYYEYLDAPAIVELINQTINPFTKLIEEKDLDIITQG